MDDFSFLRNPSLVHEEKTPLVPNPYVRLPVMKEFSAKSVSDTVGGFRLAVRQVDKSRSGVQRWHVRDGNLMGSGQTTDRLDTL
jgi:hypothetical protein